jgi:hypothetical protein
MKLFLTSLLIMGCACFASADSPVAATESQKSHLQKRVQAALVSKDAKALLSLYCLDRTEPSTLEGLERRAIPEMLKGEYLDSSFTEVPPDALQTYILKGVTYSPNLTPVIALVVKFKVPAAPVSFKTSGPSSITMILGIKDGSLLNVCSAPNSPPGTHP